MKKILIVSPKFPYPATGACEQDRAGGVETFLRLGFQVYLISKSYSPQHPAEAAAAAARLGCTIVTVPYQRLLLPRWKKLWFGLTRILRPWYLDGAAFEYAEPGIQQAVKKAIEDFKPDLAWFDYTYLWPLYKLAREKKIPIITRSINFEPRHFLEEDGVSFINLILYLPKLISEILAARLSDCLAVLNPHEAKIYARLGAKKVFILPLRGLPPFIGKNISVKDSVPLHVLYMSSTYQVAHNKRTLLLILRKIIPEIQAKFPNQFIFHFCGSKPPPELLASANGQTIIYEGFIPAERMENFLAGINIAISPSVKRVGMQGKVFEPLARGIPLITSPQNIVGYPFYHQQSVLLAATSNEYAAALQMLRDFNLRKKLSKNAAALANILFSREALDSITLSLIDSARPAD